MYPARAAGGGGRAVATLTMFLILRAFASGCAAMTGTEAISNGVSALEKPEADNAGKTLIAMAVLLGIMFLGITYLARTVQVMSRWSMRAWSPSWPRCVWLRPPVSGVTGCHGPDSGAGGQHGVCRFSAPVLHPVARWLCPPAIGQPGGPPGIFQWHRGVSLPGGTVDCDLRRADA